MRIVESNEALVGLVADMSGAPYLALDTEFLRDQTYYPRLCLIQAAAPGVEAIIDPLAPGIDLAPFYDLVRRPDIVKVLHAARQDIEIFCLQGGVVPDPLFDTQIAAMVCGFGDAASYETLARKVAKVEIDKSARFTDWSHRPLSKRQLEYALADVTHLRVIYEWMKAQLEKTGRAAWVAEEVAALQDPGLYRQDPEMAWRRLKPRTTNKRFLAVLAALAAWREREAQNRDVPRGRILKDEALSEIAAHPPETPEALERIRSVPKGFANSRMGKALMEAIVAARDGAAPEGALAENRERRRREPSPAVVDLLKTLLRLKAEEAGVAPRLIATSEDIERLAANEDDGVMALSGWRREVYGEDAIALRNGQLAIALENGEAVVVELEGEDLAR
ncbi:MAG: ribonuclease D [Alphaproteobacteria bacterium 64-11]|nr:ribonuclease D [Alphaproteobacteria bacterium]OJU07699.1 MAG: ribonuclease D [Alphaproteobacteria bacterium 64-11]